MSFFGALKHGFSNFYRPTRKDIPQLIETVFIHIEMCIDFSFSRILVLCRNFERTFHHLSNPEFCGVSRMFLGGGGGAYEAIQYPLLSSFKHRLRNNLQVEVDNRNIVKVPCLFHCSLFYVINRAI